MDIHIRGFKKIFYHGIHMCIAFVLYPVLSLTCLSSIRTIWYLKEYLKLVIKKKPERQMSDHYEKRERMRGYHIYYTDNFHGLFEYEETTLSSLEEFYKQTRRGLMYCLFEAVVPALSIVLSILSLHRIFNIRSFFTKKFIEKKEILKKEGLVEEKCIEYIYNSPFKSGDPNDFINGLLVWIQGCLLYLMID